LLLFDRPVLTRLQIIPASYNNMAKRIHIPDLPDQIIPSSPQDISMPVPPSGAPSGMVSPMSGMGTPVLGSGTYGSATPPDGARSSSIGEALSQDAPSMTVTSASPPTHPPMDNASPLDSAMSLPSSVIPGDAHGQGQGAQPLAILKTNVDPKS